MRERTTRRILGGTCHLTGDRGSHNRLLYYSVAGGDFGRQLGFDEGGSGQSARQRGGTAMGPFPPSDGGDKGTGDNGEGSNGGGAANATIASGGLERMLLLTPITVTHLSRHFLRVGSYHEAGRVMQLQGGVSGARQGVIRATYHCDCKKRTQLQKG